MKKTISLLVLCLAWIGNHAVAQQQDPYNLGFEQTDKCGTPLRWMDEVLLSDTSKTIISTDNIIALEGERSGCMCSISANAG